MHMKSGRPAGTYLRNDPSVNTLVIYCHPVDPSHNHRVLEAVIRGLTASETVYEVLDLYQSGFDPRLNAVEYQRMFVTRATGVDDDVRHLQAQVAAAANLVFVYPVWWYAMPAYLKGYMDRVFTPGFAYRFMPYTWWRAIGAEAISRVPGVRYLLQPYAARGLLKGKRAYIFRTYGGPRSGRRLFGNTTTALEQVVLRMCGITDIAIRELYGAHLPGDVAGREQRFLARVERVARTIRND
jgi:putative NADPH-quinone reductase